MSIVKQRLHRKNAAGVYDTIHLETSSDIVMQSAGMSLENRLSISLPKCHNTDDQPASLQDGEYLVSPSGKLFVGVNGHVTIFEPITEYIWKKYNVNYSYTYYWNRYNTSTVYTWNKYNVSQTATETVSASNTTKYSIDNVTNMRTFYKSRPSIVNGKYSYAGISTVSYNICSSSTFSSAIVGYCMNCTDSSYALIEDAYLNGMIGRITSRLHRLGNLTTTKGSLIGSVTGSTSSTYPTDGISSSYWYTYTGTSIVKGTTAGSVSSSSRNTYPNDGVSGSYWYVYSRSSSSSYRGSYIEDIISTDKNAYPTNGISGSYWYVLQT